MKILRFFMISAAVAGALSMVSCGSKENSTAGETKINEEQTAVEAVAEEAAVSVIVLGEGEKIAPADGKMIVLDFNATWCGPCKKFAPNFEAVAKRLSGKAVFYSVDVDVHPDLAAQYGVESIPMVAYILPSGKVEKSVGYMDEAQFSAQVAALLN